MSEPQAEVANASASKGRERAKPAVSADVRKANMLTWAVLAIFGGKFVALLIFALAARLSG